VSFLRGIGDSGHNTTGAAARFVRPSVHLRRDTRTATLCEGTLACARCDAPVSAGGQALTMTTELVCPFCAHRAPVRDFLSLAAPTRPARVVVRLTRPG
jgi:DNA-directed RNA polymerase subunit RPC12/RpoP